MAIGDTSFYKYYISACDILFSNGDVINLNNDNVSNLAMEKNFDENHFPIIKLNVVLRPKVYYRIIKDKLGVKFRLRLQKSTHSEEETDYNYREDIINDIFSIYMDDATPFMDENNYDDIEERDGGDGTIMRDFTDDYLFFLFQDTPLDNSKTIVNKVIQKANLTDTLAFLLSKSGFDKLLLSPLDNKKEYDQIILQPITALGNIYYLNQQYGFYNNGMTLFFDFNNVYLLSRKVGGTAFRKNEIRQTVFSVKELTNPNSMSPGSYYDKDNKKTNINIVPTDFKVLNMSVLEDQIVGNNMIVIHPLSGEVTKVEPKGIQRGKGTYKVVVNNYNNENEVNAKSSDIEQISTVVSVNFSDFDISAISVNKDFLFVFENKKLGKELNGSYRMTDQFINFTKKGTSFFITGTCQLRKGV